MKLLTYGEICDNLRRKEEQIVRTLNRNARRSSLRLSPKARKLRTQKIEAQNVALNTFLNEIRDIMNGDTFKFSDCGARRFYLVTPNELPRLKKDSLVFYMDYEGKFCKLATTPNSTFSRKNYHLYLPSVEKILQENPIK